MSNKSISVFELLVSKSKKNSVTCEVCNKAIIEAHLYCIKISSNNKGDKVYQGDYTVGCTHEDWDGESWCDSCVTIADRKIQCTNCAKIKWGKPSLNNKSYMWVDGSESSYT